MIEVRNVLTGKLVGLYLGQLDLPLDGHNYIEFRRVPISGIAAAWARNPEDMQGYDVSVTINKLYFGEDFVYFLGVVTDTQMDRVEGYRTILHW